MTLFLFTKKAACTQDFGAKETTLANAWDLILGNNKTRSSVADAMLATSVFGSPTVASNLKNEDVKTAKGHETVAIVGTTSTNSTECGQRAMIEHLFSH